ncbi:MAG: aspartate aminotransferase family protein [Lachnospiraceae bacterium]|nr:aspartate aminotransferase family protein [Lachnospiraceae bacterium]
MGSKMEELTNLGSSVIMNTYGRFPVALDYGDGVYMYDVEGKKYIDFVAGIAVNSLGTNHERLVSAISEQAKKLIHCSNLYYTEPQISLAKALTENSDFDKVFFCNSGAEAVESALKLMRKYADMKGKPGKEIITMEKSFHGRTYGAVTATGQDKYHKGFGPLLPGIKHVKYNDFEALESQVSEKTCGILMEVMQGEGGIIPADAKYLKKVRELCDEKDILLVFDEVQTGVGRTGELFAYQLFGVAPDGATFAKGLAGGVPIGAFMANDKAASAFKPGDHASTFGGNPLATAAAGVVLDELLNRGLLENVKKQGKYLNEKLLKLQEKHKVITDVRGIGLMQGVELSVAVGDIISECIKKGLFLVGAGPNVIRFVPPLIIKEENIDEAMGILDSALTEKGL